jgi:cysteine desulfurase
MIYLDNNATTALDRRVAEAMLSCWSSGPLNASSQHALGRAARNRLDDAVSQIGRLLGGDVDSPAGDSLILTSGGTEANNLAISGIGDPAAPLVVSGIEHPSVLEPAARQAATGRELRVIPVSRSGTIDLEAAQQLILHTQPRPSLVSVMAANNETGVVQPLLQIADICRAAAVSLHVDAVQVIGKLPFSFSQCGAAAMTVAAHKFHGPAGIGGLLLRSGMEIRPIISGGDQQLSRRAGTEPVALAVGMAEALRLANELLEESAARMRTRQRRLEAGLAARLDGLVVHGTEAERLPGTTCVSFPAVDRQTMLMALDFAGIACSSGSACASGSSQPSPVLLAMGLERHLVDTALRFGFSRFSTMADADQAVEIICCQYNRLGRKQLVEKSI